MMIVQDLPVVYSLSEPDFRISFSESYHVSSDFADITRISNGHISVLLEATVTWSGMLEVLYVLRTMM